MSLKVDRIQLEIVVGNDKARLRIQELNADLKTAKNELANLARQNKSNTAASNKLKEVIIESTRELDELNLSIHNDARALEKLSEKNRQGADLFDVFSDKIRISGKELKALSLSLSQDQKALDKLAKANQQDSDEFKRLSDRINETTNSINDLTLSLNNDKEAQKALSAENKKSEKDYNLLARNIEKSKKRHQELQIELENTRVKLQELSAKGEQYEQEALQLTQKIERLKKEQQELNATMDVSSMTMRELSQRSKELKAQLSILDPNSDTFKNLSEKLRIVNSRMHELSGSANESRTAIQKLADGFNRYESLLSSITLVFAALIYGANQFIQSMSEMSDVIAGVSKNTELSINEVKQLKSEFKDFNTRTGSKELLNIANQAGKLGIQGKENIKGFVKEANIAVVAFGRDLAGNAEDTINTLGRVIGAYRLNQELGWEESMRRVGSVINELGKSGTAQESNIVDYVSRLSAAGVALKVSYEDIAGIGATLDGLNVKSEMGATAVQKFMFTIVNKSAEMSRFLGVSVKDYKAMVEKDLVGTMLSILHTASQGNTGLQTMLQQIDAMDVSGERMTSTVLSLVNNVDILEQQIQISNKAWKEGTSVLDEYNIANATFAARIERAVKTITELIFALQSGLEPIILAVVEGTARMAKFITDNARAFVFILKAITVATVALVSYNLAVKLSEMWTKRAVVATLLKAAADKGAAVVTALHTAAVYLYSAALAIMRGRLTTAITLMRAFALALATNPIGLAAAAIGALTAAYFAFREETKDVTDANKELKESFAAERTAMDLAFAQVKLAKEGTKERAEAIARLNDKYAQYLPALVEEGDSLERINELQKAAIDNMNKQLEFKVRMAKLESTGAELLQVEDQITAAQLKFDKLKKLAAEMEKKPQMSNFTLNGQQVGQGQAEINRKLESDLKQAEADLDGYIAHAKALEQKKELALKEIVNVYGSKLNPDETTYTGGDTKEATKSLEQLMVLLDQLEAQKTKAAPGTGPWKDLSDEIEKTKKSIGEYLDLLYPDKAEFTALLDEALLDIKKQFTTDDPVKIPIEVMPLENEDFTDKQTDYLVKKHAATLDGRRALNELSYQNDIISYAEYLDVKAELDKEADASKMERAKAFWQSTQNFMQAYSTYNNARMEQELAAAGKNEAKQLAIKRKYARKQQQMDIITAGINQAMGIVEIWGKWGANPVVAGILTAIELAATGLQIAAIKSKQFAKGRYNVTGADDGRVYRNVPYIGPARTGIVRQPALISERGSEGIVDHRTLYSNVRDTMGMTPMDHFRAIAAIKYDRTAVPQFAEGRYTAASSFNPETSTSQAAQYASREELGAMVGMMSAYMQKVDAWQREFVVKNDPRSTMEEYDKYKSVENRAKG